MLIVISPAKTLDMHPLEWKTDFSNPDYLQDSVKLVEQLRKYSPGELQELMHINPVLGRLTFERFAAWDPSFTTSNAKPALLAFRGAVYQTLRAETFSTEDLIYSQQHLRILSGLYGILRPLDLIQAYRLEMGIRLTRGKYRNLQAYWQQKITNAIRHQLENIQGSHLINLASAEYFKSIDRKALPVRIITPHFLEERNGKMTMITMYAKMARGRMTRFILKNRFRDPEQIKLFEEDGYLFNERLSMGDDWYFTR